MKLDFGGISVDIDCAPVNIVTLIYKAVTMNTLFAVKKNIQIKFGVKTNENGVQK